ncbi:unannotated protein [freshwater metagenome]|uniref:Unannotated protein n=1 Tax=freshwater metagenome TaxID=449393 RepID=A0A6J7SP58_9ZZZZ
MLNQSQQDGTLGSGGGDCLDSSAGMTQRALGVNLHLVK